MFIPYAVAKLSQTNHVGTPQCFSVRPDKSLMFDSAVSDQLTISGDYYRFHTLSLNTDEPLIPKAYQNTYLHASG